MAGLIPFALLMERPDVVALADRMFSDGGPPDEMQRFLALTLACAPVTPEHDFEDGTADWAASGCCLLYVREESDLGSTRWEPWTCEIALGASASFTFASVDRTVHVPLWESDDDWAAWGAATRAMLGRSRWLVTREPATLGR